MLPSPAVVHLCPLAVVHLFFLAVVCFCFPFAHWQSLCSIALPPKWISLPPGSLTVRNTHSSAPSIRALRARPVGRYLWLWGAHPVRGVRRNDRILRKRKSTQAPETFLCNSACKKAPYQPVVYLWRPHPINKQAPTTHVRGAGSSGVGYCTLDPKVQGSNPWGTGRWGLAVSPWLWRWAVPPASGPHTYRKNSKPGK